jgi:choice-of-anchor C domain-containing protein
MKPVRILAGAAFAAVSAFAVAVPFDAARAVTITNGSFESGPVVPDGQFITLNAGDGSVTGWTINSGSIDYIQGYWQAADGTHSLDLNGLSAATISQLVTGLTLNTSYTVSFYLSGNPDAGPTNKTLDVTASAGSQSYLYTIGANTRSNMDWVQETFTFLATDSSALLSFVSTVTSGGTNDNPAAFGPALDNVSIVATTPLPAALPLFASGLGLLGFLRYRRQRAAA